MATSKNGYGGSKKAKRISQWEKKKKAQKLHIQYLKDMHGNGAAKGKAESKNTNC